MAYLRDILKVCDGCRRKQAVVELFNNRNAPLGHFCRRCGNARLSEQQRQETSS